MARMHSRDKGKAGSKKPSVKKAPTWLRYSPKETEMLIVKLAKEGKSPSQIGMTLRDAYGLPDVSLVLKKKITKILEEKDLALEIPEDLRALIKKVVAIRKHLETNNPDKTAKRGLILTESKIKRLVKYYKKTGKLTSEWKYDPKNAALFLE